MLPNWLGVGVSRSGTTTLTEALKRHPQIYLPSSKEAHFFHQNLDPQPIDVANYEATFFGDWAGEPSVGEFTPKYLVSTTSVRRMTENMLSILGKDTKFIVSFRHPVRRAYSDHRFQLKALRVAEQFAPALKSPKAGQIDPSSFRVHSGRSFKGLLEAVPREIKRFASAITGGMRIEDDGPLSRSIYGRPFKEMLEVVPRENVFVVIFEEDIEANLSATLHKLQEFLGVDPLPAVSQSLHVNRIVTPEFTVFEEPGLARLSDVGGDAATAEREVPAGTLVMRTGWRPWDKVIVNPSPQTRTAFLQLQRAFQHELSEQECNLLFEQFYASDVALLEELTGRDLTCWRHSAAELSG